jgi:molecular chaperone DnaK
MAIEDLVVSVPELWQRGVVNQGAENLMKILRDDLKLPVRQLLSEPVAAVAYYIWKSQLAEGAKKRILVCDMGGGTFDVALCEASRNTVSVIDFDGNDSNQAGVSDLKGILRNVYGRAERPIDETSFEFIRDLWDLDRNIVMDANGRKLELAYRNYENSPERYGAMPVFNSGELSVTAADAFEAFDGIYKGIHTVLNKIKQRQGGHLEFDQLLMVGGFSQYFLVRKTILDYFKLAETHEKVKIIPRNDSLFAISYGATLVAANQVEIKELYPHSIFYIGYSWSQQEVEIPIITAGKEIKPDTPHFAKQEVKIIGNDFDLKGYVQMEGDAKRQQEFKKPVKLNFKADLDKRYKIGIEINRSNMAVCVIRDAANQEHKIPLGELFKKGIYPVTD